MAPDNPSFLLNIICFFFPWAGLIVYLVTKDMSPRKARSVGKSSLAGGLLYLIAGVLLVTIVWRVQSYLQAEVSDTFDQMMKEEEAAQKRKAQKRKEVKRSRTQ